jgi:predicted nucleic acid-binding protein
MDASLLDTDALSEVLKGKDPRVLANAQTYLAQHARFAFSAVTAYEIIRGLKARRAVRQLTSFLRTLGTSTVYAVDMTVLLRAADLWADARRAATRRATPTSSSRQPRSNTGSPWSPGTRPIFRGFAASRSRIGGNRDSATSP